MNRVATFVALLLGLAVGSVWSIYSLITADPTNLPELTHEPEPVVVAADVAYRQVTAAGGLTPQWTPAEELQSPVGGVVGWTVATGSELASGAPIVAIDGVKRLYAPTPEPFWRPLDSRSSGRDVEMLLALLVDWGYEVNLEVDRSIDYSVRSELRELATALGMSSTEARSITAFDPAWVVWAPTESFIVHTVPVTVGHRVEAGTVLALSPQSLATVDITVDQATPPLADKTPYPFEQFDETFVDGPWRMTVVSEGGETLTAGSFQTIAEGLSVASRKLPLGAVGRWTWAVELVDPISQVVIPLSAYRYGPSGECVISPNGDPVPISAITTSLATMAVAGLEPGAEILANPAQLDPTNEDPCR